MDFSQRVTFIRAGAESKSPRPGFIRQLEECAKSKGKATLSSINRQRTHCLEEKKIEMPNKHESC